MQTYAYPVFSILIFISFPPGLDLFPLVLCLIMPKLFFDFRRYTPVVCPLASRAGGFNEGGLNLKPEGVKLTTVIGLVPTSNACVSGNPAGDTRSGRY